MKQIRRIIEIVLIVVIAICLLSLNHMRKTRENEIAVEMYTVQSSINELRKEKRELEEELQVLLDEKAEADENEDTEDSKVSETVEKKYDAALCVVNMTDNVYENVFNVMKENKQSGVVVLRNGRLPGNNGTISVENFVALINSGWNIAITIQSDDYTLAQWKSAVEEYVENLGSRTGIRPKAYCFAGDETPEQINIIKTEGFETIFVRSEVSDDEVKVIRMLPYAEDDLLNDMSQMNGYCAVEAWESWNDDTEEVLRYDDDKILSLLYNDALNFTAVDKLMPLTAFIDEDGEIVEGISQEDLLRQKIAAIEEEIAQLYKD